MTQVQEAAGIEVQLGCEEGGFQEVTCSFCGGQGKDPFGIMSLALHLCRLWRPGASGAARVSPALRPLRRERDDQDPHLHRLPRHRLCA